MVPFGGGAAVAGSGGGQGEDEDDGAVGAWDGGRDGGEKAKWKCCGGHHDG